MGIGIDEKRLQVVEDSKAEVPVADAVQEGGENPSERRCTFMELALCLAPGLDVSAVNVLYRAAAPALQVRLSCSYSTVWCWFLTAGPDCLWFKLKCVLGSCVTLPLCQQPQFPVS